MNAIPKCNLWINTASRVYYLIPIDVPVSPGEDQVYNLDGKMKYVKSEEITPYVCTKERAYQFLKEAWETSFQETKRAWKQLFEFSQKSGMGHDMEKLKSSFIDGLREPGVHANEAFDWGKKIVEDFRKTILLGEPESEQEQQNAVKNLFGSFNEIISSFDPKNVENIVKDPDAWAEEMYKKVCGDMDKKAAEENKERLNKDIKESIARGLRNAGMSPSQDWKQKKEK